MKYNEEGDRHERDIMLWRFQYIWTDPRQQRERYDRNKMDRNFTEKLLLIKDDIEL